MKLLRQITLAALTVILMSACASGPHDRGPLPVRNQHPAQLTVGYLVPRRAAAVAPGDVELRPTLAYTSLFLAGADIDSSFNMDGEILRAGLEALDILG